MGWIKLHRELLDSQIFASEKGLKIWIWILLKANHKQKFVPVKIGKGESIVNIERGQFLFGRFAAEEDLNINGSTIYRWIKKMEQLEMIELNSNSHYTVLTVCKYNIYNDIDLEKVTPIEQPLNSKRTAIEHKQEGKESKEGKEIKISQDDIDEIYNAYPTKCPVKNSSTGKSKKTNQEKIKSLLIKDYTKDELKSIILRYVDLCVKDKVYMKNFGTFLNNIPDYSDDELSGDTTEAPSEEELEKQRIFKGFEIAVL